MREGAGSGFVFGDGARRDCSIDVTGRAVRCEKVLDLRAFPALIHRRREAKMTEKIALTEHIKGNVRRVE